MTPGNYGKNWCSDHCLAIASFNLLDENEMKKCFNWIAFKLMYVRDIFIQGDKIDMRMYLLQEIKANYFMKLNAQEG